MAFKMSYTDLFGEEYPESYWRVVETNLAKPEKRGRVVFYGYPSEAQKGKRIIGQKEYAVDQALFEAHFETPALSPDGDNPYKAAYALALEVKDIQLSPAEGEEEGEKVSFFANAKEV